jgi:hypothetical protein
MPLTKLNSASVIDRLPVGSVLQVTYATTNAFSNTSSTSFAATAIKANITPKFSTSKILIQVQVNGLFINQVATAIGLAIYKGIEGSTMSSLAEFDNATGYVHADDHAVYGGSVAYNFLMSDAIGNTGNNRFEIYYKRVGGSNAVYVNNYAASNETRSSVTLTEIKG